jgi:hypothetical protein
MWLSYEDNEFTIENDWWYHVAVTFDDLSDKVVFYVNGQVGSEHYTPYGYLEDMTEMFNGCEGYSSRYFNGLIDEVTIYNRALTPSEIEELYESMMIPGFVIPEYNYGTIIFLVISFTSLMLVKRSYRMRRHTVFV